ncbi:MAG: 50S ribosomal protein L23 [Chloroflexi bacterium]|nr:50S ribosomal protein L23 [Chloroflexota bacterium]
MHHMEVLVRPVVTEKSTLLQERDKYVFEVTPKATKTLVKQAVQMAYNVRVLDVNMLMNRGKLKRFGRRVSRTRDTKKAIVTVQSGDRIQIFEGA